ncbi:hypothetical protein KIPB_000542 [Kipferlia bialata]|uniref:Uncharacterized protein n=1 Tax=Kipferlia bialata TaxID=797122 RepID=A0A9K3CP88_9EUKA|nr:hypothetical protein KIPB_000542 [Kipferlia bialata]|eukprot:g542.t1
MIAIPPILLVVLGLLPAGLLLYTVTSGFFVPDSDSGESDDTEDTPLVASEGQGVTQMGASYTAKDLGIESDGQQTDFGIDGIWLYKSLAAIILLCVVMITGLYFMRGMLYRKLKFIAAGVIAKVCV